MEELQITKGKSVTIPKIVNRYIIMYYHIDYGWQLEGRSPYVNPESAIQEFIERQNKYPEEKIKYYKVVEVELEIPFVQ